MVRGRVLVIAGSDSSGGAGLEADQKVITVHGCYAMTATTALTAQNTLGVQDIHCTPPEFVRKLIRTCISDIGVDVVKTGMLASGNTIRVVAECLREFKVETVVVDPVMVSTSGSKLLPQEAVRDLIKYILPLTTVLTPNYPEAKLLLSEAGEVFGDATNVTHLVEIAKALLLLGPKYVLVKGGHLPFKMDGTVANTVAERAMMIDILCGEGQMTKITSSYQESKNTHGTGCSLASAIASNLAKKVPIIEAVKRACQYVEAGIRTATDLGHGNGPINHFHSTYTLPFAPNHFTEYLRERQDVQGPWQEYTKHPFIAHLVDGNLPLESFKCFLAQEYLLLIQNSRADALLLYKASLGLELVMAQEVLSRTSIDISGHISYCESLGMTKYELEASEESQGGQYLHWDIKGADFPACTAYNRFIRDIGQSQDWFALLIAIAPRLNRYDKIAMKLANTPRTDSRTKENADLYRQWVLNMANNHVKQTNLGYATIERCAMLQSPSRIEELVKIFIQALKMTTELWDPKAALLGREKNAPS